MSNQFVNRTSIPRPPAEYSQDYMDKLVLALTNIVRAGQTAGPFFVSTLNMAACPPNGNQLRAGDIFSDNGFLKIVGLNDAYSPSFVAQVSLGTVTVTT